MFLHGGFFGPDNYIIKSLHKLGRLPVQIVQGQYDTICPMAFAWQVATALPGARLYVSPVAAHDASETENRARLQQLIAGI
ncbi:alpha/beta fold hydrolase [Lacimicrobium alkaliphilum]|uniref:alpha/beta fold hydrolase n=1 Tax=Lacimicrobium alkaliphilum TaxID=1526571 RepID=UPI000BFEED78|nr:hypothetical protein [Lacimicrobium alkaliphilum]